jgi:hypothetical protein
MRIFFCFIVCISFFSCKEEIEPDKLDFVIGDREVKVSVLNVLSISPFETEPIQGAEVQIFDDLQEFNDPYSDGLARTTDSTGRVEFLFLKEDRHYFRISHPIFGIERDSVSTPSGTISFLEILY